MTFTLSLLSLLSLLSRVCWLGVGVALVWMLRASVARQETECRPFASGPAPAPAPRAPPAPESPAPVARVTPDPPSTGWVDPSAALAGPRELREIRPGCPRDAVRARTAHHTRVLLPRELASWMLDQEASAPLRPTRALPESRFGQIVGLRLVRAPRGESLQRLGFEPGDVVETLNGYDLATPDHALEAYARLRTADRFVAVVERRGLPHVVYVTIC
ncbi:MAG: hypothetical protein IPF92_06480 [Myxococcales bacterium]|nr:hypothetical protein [Myxococcales bacterium]MBL0192690.1 hypothetical protein [Myxococcales bacterium]HQY63988.1 hypothetical protein [Polyangiaceae bacterium]